MRVLNAAQSWKEKRERIISSRSKEPNRERTVPSRLCALRVLMPLLLSTTS